MDAKQKKNIKISNYRTGEIKYKTYCINEQIHGTKSIYYQNGNLRSVVEYENNLKNGSGISYSESGMIKREANYINGRLDGIETIY